MPRGLVRVYPLLHALYEGANFAYGCSYLLGASFYSPALHAARLLICRASPDQLVRLIGRP
eukprot:4577904-Pyramimonas_sp.AAC.1